MSCANIVPPGGGPRDTIPPELLKAEPRDSSVNFRGKTITLTFDEYIDIKDQRNNVLFTPVFDRPPKITTSGRSLTIEFQDTLLPNTTYVLSFGNGITDMNEGNALKNFVYAFSTGPHLDSLKISGRVLLAETGGVDSTLNVVLHNKLYDSAVKERPQYVVRPDRNGYFSFHYLPADSFAIYVVGEPSFQQRYQDPKRQFFAFTDRPVMAGRSDSIVLYAYREQGNVTTPSANALAFATRVSPTDRRLRLNPASTGNLDLHSDFVLNFPIPLKKFDSTKISLTTDSVFLPAVYSAALDSAGKELRIRSSWKENTRYNLVLQKDFAADTAGRQLLKTDTLFFTTRKLADYGTLTLRIRNLDASKNPVLLFVQNNAVVLSAPIKAGVYTNSLFLPGEYELRILYDVNGNGKWDPGQFFGTKKQPELVRTLSQGITVKAAWENEFERVF